MAKLIAPYLFRWREAEGVTWQWLPVEMEKGGQPQKPS